MLGGRVTVMPMPTVKQAEAVTAPAIPLSVVEPAPQAKGVELQLQPARNLGGRPPTYDNAKDLQQAIDNYFESKKTPVYDKDGCIVDYKPGPYTLSGLAYACGVSRMTLLRYESKDTDMCAAIATARARVEEYAEGRLYDKEGSNGAKFALANNHEGWSEQRGAVNNNLILIGDVSEAAQLLQGMAGYLAAQERNVTPLLESGSQS